MAKTIEEAREYQRLWYHKNRSARLAANKAYRQKNADRLAARSKQRYFSNVEESRAYSREAARRFASLQSVSPDPFASSMAVRQWQRRLGAGRRGAITKFSDTGGSQRFLEAYAAQQISDQLSAHDQWLEEIDLLRMAERSDPRLLSVLSDAIV